MAEREPTDAGELLRAVMRHVPSPVTVVTVGGDAPRGVTIGSFTSLSLDPALVSFNLMKSSGLRPFVEVGVAFNVHILSDEQAALGYHFAIPGLTGEQQFGGIAHTLDPRGVPVLGGVVSRLACRAEQLIEVGDHLVVIGAVEMLDGPSETAPAIYLDGAFRRVGNALDATPADAISTLTDTPAAAGR